MDETQFNIRDAEDYPVLYTAIIEDVDILITGDKDFANIEIENIEILTPSDFMDKYL
jgi:predicted nucleic acid-binding protein